MKKTKTATKWSARSRFVLLCLMISSLFVTQVAMGQAIEIEGSAKPKPVAVAPPSKSLMCEPELKQCLIDRKHAEKDLGDCKDYVVKYCTPVDASVAPSKWTPTPAVVAAAPVRPAAPAATATTAPTPAPTADPAPEKEPDLPKLPPSPKGSRDWECRGEGHTPAHAPKWEGCSCVDDKGKESLDFSPIVDGYNHIVWCARTTEDAAVAAATETAEDLIQELEDLEGKDAKKPLSLEDHKARVKRIRDLLKKIEELGDSKEEKEKAKALEERLKKIEDRLKALEDDVAKLKADAQAPQSLYVYVRTSVAYANGVQGRQSYAMLHVLPEYGEGKVRFLAGVMFGGTMTTTKAPSEYLLAGIIALHWYTSSVVSFELHADARTGILVAGNSPCYYGSCYKYNGQYAGTSGVLGLNVDFALGSHWQIGGGPQAEFGRLIATLPDVFGKERLDSHDGWGWGANLYLGYRP